MRRAAILFIACCAAVLSAAPAHAATATVSGTTLHVIAQPGETNAITISAGLTVVDGGVTLISGATASEIVVDLNDGNDTLTVTAATRATVTGGDGDDVLKGGSGADTLRGGAGDDQLFGNSGGDTLDGGAGDNLLNGGSGTDTVDSSASTDALVIDLNDFTSVENATGGSGDDRLIGTSGANVLTGGAGDDTFDGKGGSDAFAGGIGTDTVDYSARTANVYADIDGRNDDGEWGERDTIAFDVERLLGGAGSDTLTGDDDANAIDGGAGNDRVDGNGGDDTLTGGTGDDRGYGDGGTDTFAMGAGRDQVWGGDGNDRLDGGDGNDDLWGNAGDDIADGGAGNDRIDGHDGNDLLYAGSGDDRLDGSAGTDRLIGDIGNDYLDGDDGNDVLDAGAGDDTLTGDLGDDSLTAGDGADNLHGDGGNDSLTAGTGNDTADGDSGNDTVTGSAGDDKLYGGEGNDRLAGASGNDVLSGEAGNDVLAGDDHNDVLSGGDGSDALSGGAGNDALRGGSGNDALSAATGDDDLWGDSGDDLLDGSSGNDELYGGDGADSLTGGTENDVLRGDSGADRLSGSDGNDVLSGGSDDDVLVGGGGADELAGDDGWDTADYSTRTDALVIDLDDQRDDGARGEGDNVRSSIDVVIGGTAGDSITGHGGENYLYGEGGGDRLDGGAGNDRLYGGPGNDRLIGGSDPDELDGAEGNDRLWARDDRREAVRCGPGRDRATTDSIDMLFRCERAKAGDPTRPTSFNTPRKPARVKGIRVRTGGGRFVDIPGFPGERVDRRLLPDIAYLVRKYHVHVTDGYALSGHAEGGEHPIGLAVDLVPGPGGSWNDIDRLAKWAEPRQNHPRAPFRWVGYNGDRNHGRGNHLHLSWSHTATKPGRAARTVWTLALAKSPAKSTSLTALARSSNHRLGRRPSVRTGLSSPAPCSGSAALTPIFKGAARAFHLKWQILAGLTQVESNHGCNMGPSSAGAIGWTQFMPATWRGWGMDADGDGKASPYNAVDAIYSSARYLRANSAPGSYRRALFAYNHANWYVDMVLTAARKY